MDDKTLQALTDLANKLGTTAEYLWGVLLRQAPIYAVTSVLMLALALAAILALARFVHIRTRTPLATKEDKYPTPDWHSDVAGIAWALVFLTLMIWGIYAIETLPKVVYALLNPEYWALRQIIK